MPDFLTLHEMVKQAEHNLTKNDWDYLIGAAETETTLKRNRQALDRLALRPRVLRDVSNVSLEGELLGQQLRIPVLLAPIGSVQVFEAGGGASVAKAAAEFGTMMMLSSACAPSLEEVAAASEGPKIYQLYVIGDDDWLAEQIQRTIDAKYVGFCLTVDTQVYSRRERDISKRYVPASGRRAQASAPQRVNPGMGFSQQAKLTWETVKRIKDGFDIPLILKGIATAADAVRACELGVNVVYVSNHGGRQLDHGLGTMEMLPEIVEAVDGRAQIVVDGGFYRGSDVIKALGLGADAVGVGRLEGLAMAAGGAPAVVRMLEILEHEMQIALALLGRASLSELSPEILAEAMPVGPAHVKSAFPLLEEGY
jgi:isopentenyl diphosphate isomerase/L-lactate dehydrogenase-like FMN-dependent dehydrogenase